MLAQVSTRAAFRRAEPDARRQSLIEACARVLACAGVAGTSVRAIALEAGVSPGLVNHYFTSVDDLVAAAYAEVGARVDAALEQALAAAADDPRARLEAFATASFAPPIADPQLLATWIAFWGLARSQEQIAAEHARQYSGFRARLEELLFACGVAPERLRLAAIGITAMIDGLWLELCLSPDTLTPDEARAIVRVALDALTS